MSSIKRWLTRTALVLVAFLVLASVPVFPQSGHTGDPANPPMAYFLPDQGYED